MPPPSTTEVDPHSLPEPVPTEGRGEPLGIWVRAALVGIAAGLVVVFVLAVRLNPYNPDGSPRRMATHTQLGLQPCTMAQQLGIPCPSCGMTTSFALLMHGDVLHSLQANWVGTLLCSFCLAVIPWSVVSVVRNRALFVRSLEKAVICVIVVLLTLMLFRWVIVLSLGWYQGWPPPT